MSKQAVALYDFLKEKKAKEKFTLEDMSNASGYKLGSVQTKKNHCLKNVYITETETAKNTFEVIYEKIHNASKEDFVAQISQRKNNTKVKTLEDILVENSKSFILSAIELHNKPNFPSRYDIVIILIVSAWEKLFKAHILKLKIKVEQKDQNIEKLINILKKYPYDQKLIQKNDPITNIKSIGKNIKMINKYRNEIVHFYLKKDLDIIIFNLIFKNIIFYAKYLKEYFKIDIQQKNDLFLLPIGFKNHEDSFRNLMSQKHEDTYLQNYINALKKDINDLKGEETIFIDFNYSIGKKGEKTNSFVLSNEGQEIKLKEEDIKEKYPYNHDELCKKLKDNLPGFIRNSKFHEIKKKYRGNSEFAHCRKLNPSKQKSQETWFYSEAMINKIKEEWNKQK